MCWTDFKNFGPSQQTFLPLVSQAGYGPDVFVESVRKTDTRQFLRRKSNAGSWSAENILDKRLSIEIQPAQTNRVESVKRFVNVHLHCIVSNQKRISKITTLLPPGKISANAHGYNDFEYIVTSCPRIFCSFITAVASFYYSLSARSAMWNHHTNLLWPNRNALTLSSQSLSPGGCDVRMASRIAPLAAMKANRYELYCTVNLVNLDLRQNRIKMVVQVISNVFPCKNLPFIQIFIRIFVNSV